MKVIVWDYERDREYRFKNVSEDKLKYCLECYKQIYRKEMRKNELGKKIKAAAKRINLLTSVILFISVKLVNDKYIFPYIYDQFLADNIVPFNDDNEIIIDENELEEICGIIEKELGVTIVNEEKDEYLLLDAIKKNKNLTSSQKEFCYQYIDLFIDNQYLDKKEVYHSLLNVEVTYTNRPKNVDSRVKGRYDYFSKEIEIYETDENNSYLAHELIHCISCDNNKLPRFFDEGMTELLSNEYFSKTPFYELTVYPYHTVIIKMLCEATSPDTVLKAYTYGDMNYIIDEMTKYIGDRKEVENSINVLSTILNDNLYGKTISYTKEEIEKECISKIRRCVNYKVNNENMSGFSYYYNERLFSNIYEKNSYSGLNDDISFMGYDEKAYFSNKLKENIDQKYNYNNEKVIKKVK